MNRFIYWMKNIFYLLYMVGYIRLIPNIYDSGFVGTLFLIFGIIYMILVYYFIFEKNEKLNDSIPQNILSIFLYLYVFLISYKYCEITNINVVINMFYFKVNYLIIIIATFGVLINNFLISRSNDK